VISDAADNDRLMRQIVKDLRKPPTLQSVSPEPHGPRERMVKTRPRSRCRSALATYSGFPV
jgi:hypothetical protein